MDQRGLKVKDLADMAGLSPSYFSLILSGERGNLRDSHKDALAMALDTTVCELYMPDSVLTEAMPTEGGLGPRVTGVVRRPQEFSVPTAQIRDTRAFEDFITALNLQDPELVAAFYREVNVLSDYEVDRLGQVLRNTLRSWQEFRERQRIAGNAVSDAKSLGTNLGLEERHAAGLLVTLSRIFRQVPLSYLEVAMGLGRRDAVRLTSALAARGFVLFIPGQDGDVRLVLEDGVGSSTGSGQKALPWTPSAVLRHSLLRLAQHLSQEIHSDSASAGRHTVTPEELAEVYLEGQDLQEARAWYYRASEEALAEGLWRVGKERLRVVFSLDAILNTDPDQRARAGQMLATACVNLGEAEEALLYQERNLAYWERTQQKDDLVRGLSAASSLLLRLGRRQRARECLEKALAAAQGDAQAQTRVRTNLAALLLYQGHLKRARDELNRALEVATRMGEPGMMAQVLVGLGRLFLAKGDLAKSMTYFNRALALSENREAATHARARIGMGRVRFRESAPQDALIQFEKARELASSMGDAEAWNVAGAWLARCVIRNVGQDDGSKDGGLQNGGPRDGLPLRVGNLAQEALEFFRSRGSGDREGLVVSILACAEVDAWRGDQAQAAATFQECVRLTTQEVAPLLEGQACEAYADYLEEQGDDLAPVMRQRALWANAKAR